MFGSGGRISPSALRAAVALAAVRDAGVAAAASEPASPHLQFGRAMKMKKGPTRGPLFILVAGACS